MRKPVRDFVELASTTLPLQGLVYEVDSLQVQENPELEGLRSLLKPFTHSFVGS